MKDEAALAPPPLTASVIFLVVSVVLCYTSASEMGTWGAFWPSSYQLLLVLQVDQFVCIHSWCTNKWKPNALHMLGWLARVQYAIPQWPQIYWDGSASNSLQPLSWHLDRNAWRCCQVYRGEWLANSYIYPKTSENTTHHFIVFTYKCCVYRQGQKNLLSTLLFSTTVTI